MKNETGIIFVPDFCIALKEIAKFNGVISAEIHHNTKITYSHLLFMRKVFLAKEWTVEEQEGVAVIIRLTEKGREVVNGINSLLDAIGVTDATILNYRRKGKHKSTRIKKQEVEEDVDNNKGVPLGDVTHIREARGPVQESSRSQLQTDSYSEEDYGGNRDGEQEHIRNGNRFQGTEDDSREDDSREI